MSKARYLRLTLLTVGHFALASVTLLSALGFTMAAFDGQGSDVPGRILQTVHTILSLPLVLPVGPWLLRAGVSGFPFDHLLLLLNSMLWAWALSTLWDHVRPPRNAVRDVS